MTNLEYDLILSIEWMPTCWENSEAEVDCEETAKNLTKMGYQKIVWHDVKKELPERNKYVLGYRALDNTFTVIKWDDVDQFDNNEICYNIDYWTELPKIEIEK